jgi:hypothetical protein
MTSEPTVYYRPCTWFYSAINSVVTLFLQTDKNGVPLQKYDNKTAKVSPCDITSIYIKRFTVLQY